MTDDSQRLDPAVAQSPEVSFVVPARNEELLIAATLEAIHQAARAAAVDYEIVVANDDSTDRTPELARAAGARVVDVKLHNIGAVRNAGAAQARGDLLVFLDADTILPAATFAAMLREYRSETAGGGGWVEFEGVTRAQHLLAAAFSSIWLGWFQWAAGCNIFVRRDVFEAIGGFDSKYFAAEERYLSDAIKSRGRFVILREKVISSGRKLRIYKTGQLLGIAFRGLILKRGRMTSRDGLELLYDAPREQAVGKT